VRALQSIGFIYGCKYVIYHRKIRTAVLVCSVKGAADLPENAALLVLSDCDVFS